MSRATRTGGGLAWGRSLISLVNDAHFKRSKYDDLAPIPSMPPRLSGNALHIFIHTISQQEKKQESHETKQAHQRPRHTKPSTTTPPRRALHSAAATSVGASAEGEGAEILAGVRVQPPLHLRHVVVRHHVAPRLAQLRLARHDFLQQSAAGAARTGPLCIKTRQTEGGSGAKREVRDEREKKMRKKQRAENTPPCKRKQIDGTSQGWQRTSSSFLRAASSAAFFSMCLRRSDSCRFCAAAARSARSLVISSWNSPKSGCAPLAGRTACRTCVHPGEYPKASHAHSHRGRHTAT